MTRRLPILIALAALCAPPAAGAATQEGALDFAFADRGRAPMSLNTSAGKPTAASWVRILPQPDGRIVCVGGATFGTGPGAGTRVVIARYTAAGRLDTTFAGGRVITGLPGENISDAIDAALLPGGDIAVAVAKRGDPANAADDQMGLLRVRGSGPDAGKLNTFFGSGGAVLVDNTDGYGTLASERPTGLAVTGDRIFVAGTLNYVPATQEPDYVFAVFDHQGQPVNNDTGTKLPDNVTIDGVPLGPPGGVTRFYNGLIMATAVRSDSRNPNWGLGVIAADQTGNVFGNVGPFYNGLSERGRVLAFSGATSAEAGHVALTGDGRKIVAVGGVQIARTWRTAVIRADSTGGMDKSFSADGGVIVDLPGNDIGRDVAVLRDGRILVASSRSGTEVTLALIRLKVNGELDETFGGDGVVLDKSFDVNVFSSRAVALTSDGKVLAGGHDVTRSNREIRFAFARYGPVVNLVASCGPALGCVRVLNAGARTFSISVDPGGCRVGSGECSITLALEVSKGGRRVGTVSLGRAKGASTLRFDGRVAGKRLTDGRYEIRLIARRAGKLVERSRPLRLTI